MLVPYILQVLNRFHQQYFQVSFVIKSVLSNIQQALHHSIIVVQWNTYSYRLSVVKKTVVEAAISGSFLSINNGLPLSTYSFKPCLKVRCIQRLPTDSWPLLESCTSQNLPLNHIPTITSFSCNLKRKSCLYNVFESFFTCGSKQKTVNIRSSHPKFMRPVFLKDLLLWISIYWIVWHFLK